MVLSRSVRHVVILLLVACSMTTSARNDEAEWVGAEDATTKAYGTRRTTTIGEAEFIPRTNRRTTPRSPSNDGVETRTLRPAGFLPTNLTDAVTTLLKNFSKLMTDDEYSSAKDCGPECLINVVRLEVFTVAGDGHHFVLPPNKDEKIEQKQRKKASALGALWLDLFCSEDVGAILSNVTRETVARQYPMTTSLTQDKMYEILTNVFDRLDDAIEEDTFLATMYNAEQIRSTIRVFDDTSSADKKVYFSFDELKRGTGVDEDTLLEWSNNVNIRKFLIHKQFLETKYSDGEDAVAVRSILKVARERCCMDRMQKMYTSTLDEEAKNFVIADYPLKVAKTFVHKLTKAVQADEKVNEEWVKIKNEMVDETTQVKKSKGRRVSDI